VTDSLIAYTPQPERVLDVLADHRWIIVARTSSVEIYALPTSIRSNMQIEPIGRHKWQWKIDTISLARTADMTDAVVPIQFVLRYGSIHPWVSLYRIQKNSVATNSQLSLSMLFTAAS
jgi:hypothetical protein